MVNKKITSIDDLSAKDIRSIADQAIKFKKSQKNFISKKSKNIFNLFLEPSTRTTVSFELAAKKLGHKMYPGSKLSGKIKIIDIGIYQ